MNTSIPLTKEEFEAYEDLLSNSEQALPEEVSLEIGEWVVTHSGEVKIHPSLEFKRYLDARNNQKRNRSIQNFRKTNFKLVK